MFGAYISYPFCSQKCTYCNFASGVLPRSLEPRYIDALIRELRAADWLGGGADTVYFGGGTPSLIDPAGLARILTAIPREQFREATVEAAPGTVTRDLAAAWRAAGINRVSLGVQSFVTSELKRTGRKHTAEIVESEVSILRSAGITNFNLDLIAGLPGQTRASWNESLEWIERLESPHVSVYMLEVDEDSRLGSEIIAFGERYGARDVPDDDLIAELYQTAVDRLRSLGIDRYEISNFARPGFESLHNLKYWQREPYLGFGADAHSFDGRHRWGNVEAAADYVDRIEQHQSAVLDRAAADPLGEPYFLGLRLTHGIAAAEALAGPFAEELQSFLDNGLLEQVWSRPPACGGLPARPTESDRLRLTDRGVLLSNEVFAAFITDAITDAVTHGITEPALP